MNTKTSTYILAEMASSHEGDPRIAGFIIDSAAKAKADGILLQIFNLDTYIIPSDEDYLELRDDIFIPLNDWVGLIQKAAGVGLDVWANVYDVESAKFCRDKEIKGFKIHSANLENENLVEEVVKSKKELLLSIGGLQKNEIEGILKLIYSRDNDARIYFMYGLQNFPTNPEGINLNFVTELAKDFNVLFGYQDHSEPTSLASIYLPILFITKGASVIEKHITHNRSLKGQDWGKLIIMAILAVGVLLEIFDFHWLTSWLVTR